MKKVFITSNMILLLFFILGGNKSIAVTQQQVKVLNIETNSIVKEVDSSADIDKCAVKAIEGIEKVTVKANPLPEEGYLIKIPLTTSLHVKNKWFNDLVTEILLVYSPSTSSEGKLILYNDDNTPIFFDIKYDFTALLNKLDFQEQ